MEEPGQVAGLLLFQTLAKGRPLGLPGKPRFVSVSLSRVKLSRSNLGYEHWSFSRLCKAWQSNVRDRRFA